MGKYSKDKRDIYYRKAKELGFRARSAFKLMQIDEEFNLLSGSKRAVDLCAAPGSWSQVLARKLNSAEDSEAVVVAVDLQSMAPIKGVIQIQGDITDEKTAAEIISYFGGEKADIVVSDGAPDVTGMHDIDEYLQGQLILAALNICTFVLRRGGSFVAKVFRGRDIGMLYEKLQLFFTDVMVAKPKSSRNSSIEAFVVCRDYSAAADYLPSMTRMQVPAQNRQDADCKQKSRFTVQFVACGDLSGFDADASYPLVTVDSATGKPQKSDYQYIEPKQAPTEPHFEKFSQLKHEQIFSAEGYKTIAGDEAADGDHYDSDVESVMTVMQPIAEVTTPKKAKINYAFWGSVAAGTVVALFLVRALYKHFALQRAQETSSKQSATRSDSMAPK